MNDKIKVTECWTKENTKGYPDIDVAHDSFGWNRNAVLMFRDDYEALLECYHMLFDVMDSEFNMTRTDVLAEVARRMEAKKSGQGS